MRKIRPYKHRKAPVRYSENPKLYQKWYYEHVTRIKKGIKGRRKKR